MLGNTTGNSECLSGVDKASSETLYVETSLDYQGWLLRLFSPWPFNCRTVLSKATQLEEYFCLILGSKVFVLHIELIMGKILHNLPMHSN